MALADTGNEYDSVISSVFVAARLILENDLNFDPDCVNGLFLNIRYQDGSVTMTTASSLNTFTLDHSLDEAFEKYIVKFLTDADISYEE